MRRHFYEFAMAIALFLPYPAVAQTAVPAQDNLHEGWYTQLTGSAQFLNDRQYPLFTGDGRSSQDIDYDVGWAGALNFGYRFPSGFRIQAEGTYGRSGTNDYERSGNDLNIGSGELTIANGLLGLYYDFNTGARWIPFLGIGGGVAYTDLDNVPGRSSNQLNGEFDGTAYAEGGLEFLLSDNMSLIPAYRFQWINNGEHGAEDDQAHIAMLGLRFYFD